MIFIHVVRLELIKNKKCQLLNIVTVLAMFPREL